MIVFFNGQFVAAQSAAISLFDRGFLYGDGLFETVRVVQGRAFRWQQHDERLRRGAAFLKLSVPYPPAELSRLVDELIKRNGQSDAILRLTLSRGVGPRGYSIKDADSPTMAMALYPASPFESTPAPPLRLWTASIRVPADDPLAVFKSCSKLPQILARTEAETAGANEALLLNTREEVAETAAGNLFWLAAGVVCTAPLTAGVLDGVTRQVILEICRARSQPTQELRAGLAALRKADGVFVTNSSLGVSEAIELDQQPLSHSPLVGELQLAYQALVRRECGAASGGNGRRD